MDTEGSRLELGILTWDEGVPSTDLATVQYTRTPQTYVYISTNQRCMSNEKHLQNKTVHWLFDGSVCA